jgi:hypothetical protein
METVTRDQLSNLRMAAGGEKRYSVVIDGSRVKEWVGVGWVDLRKATTEDRRLFPVVMPNHRGSTSARSDVGSSPLLAVSGSGDK